MAWHVYGLHDHAIGVEIRNVDGKLHTDGVHPSARGQDERALQTSATEQATSTGGAIGCHLGAGQNSSLGDQPDHGRRLARGHTRQFYTLKRNSITSPSTGW